MEMGWGGSEQHTDLELRHHLPLHRLLVLFHHQLQENENLKMHKKNNSPLLVADSRAFTIINYYTVKRDKKI